MTVLLLLVTFLAFILVDTFLSRRKAQQMVMAPATPEPDKTPATAPAHTGSDWIDGFYMPATVRYHAGHGWVSRERKNVLRVGVDEFAAKLAGGIERIELPKPGHWVRQGQKALAVFRNGEKAEIVSPVEGEVVEINHEVVQNPALLRQDPYGKGWLMTVFAPDEESVTRNLLPKGLVQGWMQEMVTRLYAMQPQLAGAVSPDGGVMVDDLCSALPGAEWKTLTEEFFLK
ncbi:MAG: glycine cleavage system protein H [Bryobacteraceae bacterium]|nr:glycine cleavage system protein H [Bryobacteraceae bacterium]